ncbi:hypothetical protein CUJ86_09095 [Methanofollis fontis]|uniref:Uncharacterized protein n=2 Tax=Methanofollis fontis TaxID=2052832 RepID=A0A483CNH8_9EURY|nr:hypothetical protein CUJ86_09095 [Methanofollis fontis]
MTLTQLMDQHQDMYIAARLMERSYSSIAHRYKKLKNPEIFDYERDRAKKYYNNLDLDGLLNVRLKTMNQHIQQPSLIKKNANVLELGVGDLKEIWEKQRGKCFYSGVEMSTDPRDPRCLSVDRINPDEGYTKNNVALCCSIINSCKREHKARDFINMCISVARHFENINPDNHLSERL